MDDLRKNNISESIRDIGGKIAKVDGNLADLFGRIAERTIMAKDRYKGERPSYPISGKVVEDILRDIGGGRINTIPFGEPGDCLEYCLAVAYGKIKSKNGFIQITKKVNDYWLNCGVVNSGTLIFTDSWDIAEFNSWFRESCNKYTSSGNRNNVKHTVAIVLYGDYGFSLQYLK